MTYKKGRSSGSASYEAVHLIGAPLDLGGNRRGTDMGPSAFRIAGMAEQLATSACTVVDKGDIAAPIPETKGAGRSAQALREGDRARSARSCSRPRSPRSAEGALPMVLGGDHSLGAGSVAAAAAHLRKSGKPLGPDLGGRARRHEQSRRPASRATCTACRSPRCSAREPAELARFARRRARRPAEAHGAGRHPQPRRDREGDRPGVEGARLHDEGCRSPRHHRGDGARARDRRPRAPAASMSRSIWTSAIPPSPPASARRSRAASTIAKRTS